MEQPRTPADHPCPRCGAQRRADRTPSCACGRQASDALREAREAQAAAAEDFDPLRIRPYVELGGRGRPAPTPPGPAPAEPDGTAPAEPEATVPLPAAGPASPPVALTAPQAPPAGAPSATDLSLFETTGRDARGAAADGTGGGDDERGERDGAEGTGGRPRRRRGALLGAAGAAVAVVAVAGYAGGLFSYQTPSRDGALPQEVRAGVPEPSAATDSAPPEPPAATPVRTASASPSPSGSATPSASPTPEPTPSSASPTPSRSPSPTASPTTARPTATAQQPGDDGREDAPESSVLRRGDRGPRVADLQTRLRKVYLYTGEVDGVFDQRVEEALRNYQWSRGIRSDELGVYGPETRQRLEAETSGR
ncbi:peptidoglycan-binding protein [Streptomyces sp. PRKS01-65]|nr:peptidoglycan-binding protein [Streptomyces harenosi]